ncbi:MAG: bifunctional (p)ppGpp synthetase/guanosine-3',5'-bis(diphosphate) 3'-pyrophosphohydrolase [Planctomycetota bacterium]|nr:bifunctional (p)ppGpp synthetase/guanosine-3',5'-bis(diphosphate) 3'-pyrophosphohydrolase [Planctomycetota bacterium]
MTSGLDTGGRDRTTVGVIVQSALRRAAEWHAGQTRRGSGLPYLEHVCGVALALARAGFDDEVVAAGLLHDAVEDTGVTLETIRAEFGARVADIVAACSERKLNHEGAQRPWIDRKSEHLRELAAASLDARAVVLADKLHNLRSIAADVSSGINVWTLFHAGRAEVLWYYRTSIDVCAGRDPVLAGLADACRAVLRELE